MKYYCKDCPKEVNSKRIKRCWECFKKWNVGKNHHQYIDGRSQDRNRRLIRHKQWHIDNPYTKDDRLQYLYGITIEHYNRILHQQNNCCAICNRAESEFTRKLSVDHNHTTGKVRGLLCSTCNYGLGLFKDNLNYLLSAYNYLKFTKDTNIDYNRHFPKAQYDFLFKNQSGCCLICGLESVKCLAADHNHVTGKVRGLLCSNCNTGIGNFKENLDYILNAIKYLKDNA